MSLKCAICKEKIETTFLEKIKGTYLYVDSKRYVVCNKCQKSHSLDELKSMLRK